MPYFDVDVEQINYGVVRVKANSEEEAKRMVNEGQPEINEDMLFTGTAVKAIEANPSFE